MTAAAIRDALIERLVAGKGPDKHLSRDIQCQIGGWYRRTPSEGKSRHPTFIHPDDCRDGKPLYDSLHGTDIWREPTDVIASFDGALALIDRIMPGVFYLAGRGRTRTEEPLHGFQLKFGTDETLAEAEHDELCRAALIALLRAMGAAT